MKQKMMKDMKAAQEVQNNEVPAEDEEDLEDLLDDLL